MQRMQKQNRKLSKQFFVRGQHPIPTTLNALFPTLIYYLTYCSFLRLIHYSIFLLFLVANKKTFYTLHVDIYFEVLYIKKKLSLMRKK